jgi:tetratricopeptide (TPR) repeat protein
MKKLIALVTLSLTVFTTATADAESPAKIFSLQGSAIIHREGKELPAAEAMEINAGDEIAVNDPGRVALALADGSYIRLASGSRMKFPSGEQQVSLVDGALHFFSHSEAHPTVATEHVTAAIRGTEFTLTTNKTTTTINMLTGSVQGSSPGGTASLLGGQGARFSKGKAPEVYALIQSDRSVQWSAFIPLLESGSDLGLPPGSTAHRALTLAQEGKTSEALRLLSHSHKGRCGSDSVLRARILISQGDIARGSDILSSCEKTGESTSVKAAAASTLSLVRLAQGDGEGAREQSATATKLNPNSSAARFSRSLALQERGDLDGALAALDGADPNDQTLTARRAEVLFMFGRVPEARQILEAMPSRSWYADTVLGFVLMGDRSFDEAEAAFTRAANAEPGAGLPQMGLGLIAVNNGDLAAGRERFERAAVLEPSRSLYRSYLAKAYFEDDTYAPAEPEYDRAIELDPNDPTPHLYRSFMRLAENRPVEALHDIEAARDLSQKRDVFRSKFLLDEDSATQSASLSRVYRELGFAQRGRIEAISAIYDDYKNASAHRLLSETADSVFLAPSAVSERRIADLFSPLSINVADSIGTSVSLNEYSSLFEKDGWRTGINTEYSSYNDQFVSGVLSANKSGNFVTSLSASGVQADGAIDPPRTNEGRAGISLQGQPSWADRFLLEARGVFYDTDQTDESSTYATGTFNGSYVHKFSPDTSAVVQTSYRRGRDRYTSPLVNSDVYFSSPDGFLNELTAARFDQQESMYETASENEVQLIDRSGIVTSVLTGRYSYYDLNSYDHSVLLNDDLNFLDNLGVEFESTGMNNVATGGADYLATIQASDSVLFNVGADYSYVSFAAAQTAPFYNEDNHNSRLTPKGGVIYRPSKRAMARVGYGQYMGRSAFSALASVEPTLVGGINQVYQDNNPGVIAQNFGTGIDIQPFNSTYIGTEWTRRWLDDPTNDAVYAADYNPDTNVITTDVIYNPRYNVGVMQDFVNAYVYQILSDQFVLGNDYRYGRNDAGSPDDFFLENHRNRTFGRYFFTNMFFVQSGATYLYQDRTGYEAVGVPNGSDCGWMFDAAIGYRLPTRHGYITAGVNNIFGQDFVLEQAVFNERSIVINDPMVELAAKFNF